MITNYAQIDSLVERYQQGDKEAAEDLIEVFTPYMTKFIRIIKNNVIDFNNKDSRNFLLLFIPDKKVRQDMKRAKQSIHARRVAYDTLALVNKTCDVLTEEDVSQDLIVILLSLAKRYKKDKHYFCGYVYNTFKYELYRRITDITKDPLTFSSLSNIRFSDGEYEEDEFGCDEVDVTTEFPLVISEDDSVLEYNWIQGHTCGDAFIELTPVERQILVYSFQEGLDDTVIAKKLGYHRHTIRTKKLKAIEKIRGSLNETG